MISRSSFFKMLKEDGERRKTEWILAIIVFLLFIVLIPVQTVISGRYFTGNNAEVANAYILDIVKVFFSKYNPKLYVVTIVASWICGFNSMSYLFSKSKTDFYHSLPVNRQQLFLVSYTNSILIYAIPYLVTLCVGLLFVLTASGEAITMWDDAFVAYGYHLLGYCMLLNMNLVMVMLSGRLLVAALGMVATYGYGIVWYVLLDVYRDTFLYCLVDEFNASVAQVLSPVCNYILSGALAEKVGMHSLVGLMFVIAVASFVVAFMMYLKRPSCASGGTIAFAGIKPIIKAGVMLPLALLGGVIMYLTYHKIVFWIFGAVFVMVVSHVALQGILEQADIRAIRRGLKTVGIVGVMALLIVVVYYFDVFGYNGYMPDIDDVESCAVIIEDATETDYFTVTEEMEDTAQERAQRMEITDVAQVDELSKAGYNTRKRLYNQGVLFERETINSCDFEVQYNLKNGKTVKRLYTIEASEEENAEKLKSVLDNPEYKISGWLFSATGDYTIEIIGYDKDGRSNCIMIENGEEKQAIIDALKVDIMKSSVDTMDNQSGIGYINFLKYEWQNGEQIANIISTEYISNSYENLMPILEKYGFLTENMESVPLPEADEVMELIVFKDEMQMNVNAKREDILAIMPYLKVDTSYYPTPLHGTIFENNATSAYGIRVQANLEDGIFHATLDANAPDWVKNMLENVEE